MLFWSSWMASCGRTAYRWFYIYITPTTLRLFGWMASYSRTAYRWLCPDMTSTILRLLVLSVNARVPNTISFRSYIRERHDAIFLIASGYLDFTFLSSSFISIEDYINLPAILFTLVVSAACNCWKYPLASS